MARGALLLLILVFGYTNANNFNYLEPTKLQTRTLPNVQEAAASRIIEKYLSNFVVSVDPKSFVDNKDVFTITTVGNNLHIKASSGVAAVWGFNYYLKKYCKSQIAWQVSNVAIPDPLPQADETVVANDRFRYYQNVCTVSYSFVWWNVDQWTTHVEWMALNGINLVLAPVAQEAAWANLYRKIGMTDEEIDDHFTGPAFLSWLRMGNMHGFGGPLSQSWHELQMAIQRNVVDHMYRLGIVPVFPAFNGHVPTAFARIYPNSTFYKISSWNNFQTDYCCDLFVEPSDPLFVEIGRMYIKEIHSNSTFMSHIYSSDPFNELSVPVDTAGKLITNTARAIFSALWQEDDEAVWLVQNWMFVNNPVIWTTENVKSFLTSIPTGQLLVLDLHSDYAPKYKEFEMYYGQPFIWCMLHNFGGTSGMMGKMPKINNDVYEARSLLLSTMIGTGLTPEGINQNYVIYDFMLETAWRKSPVDDLELWVADYAERRYACNSTAIAWKYLLKSVYNLTDGYPDIYGQYVMTMRPSLKYRPWTWYKSRDLFKAFKNYVLVPGRICESPGYNYDLVDITRQALQYRAEQLYEYLTSAYRSNEWVFKDASKRYLDILWDMEAILDTNENFQVYPWLDSAESLGNNVEEQYLYKLNARNQITLWGPNGEITDYAAKQWAGLFRYYYIPRWTQFLEAADRAKEMGEYFEEETVRRALRLGVERTFLTDFVGRNSPRQPSKDLALNLYMKYAYLDLPDLRS